MACADNRGNRLQCLAVGTFVYNPQRKLYAALGACALFGMAAGAHAADVTVGYQLVYGPWKAKMEDLMRIPTDLTADSYFI